MKEHKLTQFNFQDFAQGDLSKESFSDFRRRAQWLLPQILAWIGSTCQLKRSDTGLYTAQQFVQHNSQLAREGKLLYEGMQVPFEVFAGMMRILTHYPRGDILNQTTQKQTSGGLRYASNVPLVLSAFKEYRNIPYSDWDWQCARMAKVLDTGLAELVPYILDPKLVEKWLPQDLIDIRITANQREVPLTSLYSISYGDDMEFKRLPRLLKLLLCQTWVYHPSIRHDMGITNIWDLDNHPEPLVSSEVPITDTDDPWSVEPVSKRKSGNSWGVKPTADLWDI